MPKMINLYHLILPALLLFNCLAGHTQQNPGLQVEAGFHGSFFSAEGDPGWGYGAGIKLLLPKNDNYISLGLIADHLQEDRWYSARSEPVNLVNLTGGYRKMLGRYYLEPQLGIGFLIEKDKADNRFETDKTYAVLNLFTGVESGIRFQRLTLALVYRLNFRDPFKDVVYNIFSLKTAYCFGR